MPARPPRRELGAENAATLRADLAAFLRRRTRDAALAEDLAQQAMLQLLAALPRFRGAATLRTWARRIAVNVWRDHQRRQAASPTVRAMQGDPRSIAALAETLDRGAPVASMEESLDRKATHHCLLDAIRQLPLEARRILLLHELGDMPLADAAAALGCSIGAAKVRLHRARRRLAERCRTECTSETGADGAVVCTPKGAAVDPPPPLRRRSTSRVSAHRPLLRGR